MGLTAFKKRLVLKGLIREYEAFRQQDSFETQAEGHVKQNWWEARCHPRKATTSPFLAQCSAPYLLTQIMPSVKKEAREAQGQLVKFEKCAQIRRVMIRFCLFILMCLTLWVVARLGYYVPIEKIRYLNITASYPTLKFCNSSGRCDLLVVDSRDSFIARHEESMRLKEYKHKAINKAAFITFILTFTSLLRLRFLPKIVLNYFLLLNILALIIVPEASINYRILYIIIFNTFLCLPIILIYVAINRNFRKIFEKNQQANNSISLYFEEKIADSWHALIEKFKEIIDSISVKHSQQTAISVFSFLQRWRGCTSAGGIHAVSEQHGLSLLSAHLSTFDVFASSFSPRRTLSNVEAETMGWLQADLRHGLLRLSSKGRAPCYTRNRNHSMLKYGTRLSNFIPA